MQDLYMPSEYETMFFFVALVIYYDEKIFIKEGQYTLLFLSHMIIQNPDDIFIKIKNKKINAKSKLQHVKFLNYS